MSNQAINWAYKQNLTAGQGAVLLVLSDMADEQWSCFPSVETIAHLTNLSTRSVVRNLNTLKELDLVASMRLRRHGKISGTRYFLNMHKTISKTKPEFSSTNFFENPYKSKKSLSDKMSPREKDVIKQEKNEPLNTETLSDKKTVSKCQKNDLYMTKTTSLSDTMSPSLYKGFNPHINPHQTLHETKTKNQHTQLPKPQNDDDKILEKSENYLGCDLRKVFDELKPVCGKSFDPNPIPQLQAVVGEAFTKASTVTTPTSFVLACIRNDPARFVAVVKAKRKTKDPVCVKHPSFLARNCGGCKADRFSLPQPQELLGFEAKFSSVTEAKAYIKQLKNGANSGLGGVI